MSPDLGDWVVGFFMDGESAQMPVMMGVLPGYNAYAQEVQNQDNFDSNNSAPGSSTNR
jgi:hypothetical protein